MEKKRLIITCVFASMFIVGTLLIFTVPLSIKITYYQTVQTDDGETISFNVFEPLNGGNNKRAVIIGHGVIVNKEVLKGYAIELAAAGFVAVPFDFRGHGMSSGLLGRGELIYDVQAIKSYLISRGDVDTSKLGYIGYSMGGAPGNEIVATDTDFKCFIGIGTSLGDANNRIGTLGNPLNVLVIIGQYDQAFNPVSAKTAFGQRIGIPASDVVYNRLYGSFENGDATKLYLDDNSDHLLTAYDESFIREARDWIISTFPDVKPVDEHFYANLRALIFFMQIIGGIGMFFLLIEPISNLIVKTKEEDRYESLVKDMTIETLFKKSITYSFIYFIPGLLIAFVVMLLPFTLAGAMFLIMFGQAFGMLILTRKLFKEANKPFGEVFKEPFRIPKDSLIRIIILGTILSIIIYLILYLSIGMNYLAMFLSIYRLPYLPIYLALFIFLQLIFLMNQKLMIEKFENTLSGIIKAGLISWAVLIIYLSAFILIPCIIANNYFLTMILYLVVPILLFVSLSSAIIYRKTNSIIPGAITNALFIVCLAGTLSPILDIVGALELFGHFIS